ncbi:MAG: recombinase family protein [Bdellovibrionales bacterium]
MVDKSHDDFFNLSSMHLRIQSTVSTTPLFRNKSFLNQKYTVEGLSARQIAVPIGCGHSTINSALTRLGIAKGERESGWLRFGKKMEDGKRVPHIREQMVIQSIQRKRRNGWSYQKISDWLSKRGIRTPSGQTRWYHSTVKRIHERATVEI